MLHKESDQYSVSINFHPCRKPRFYLMHYLWEDRNLLLRLIAVTTKLVTTKLN